MIKPGRGDRKASILITGVELEELQRFDWMMAETFGLDRRIINYKGMRPIGLYRWDIEWLVDVINSVLDDPEYYPNQNSSEYVAIKNLRERLQTEIDDLRPDHTPRNRER
jgi:hypothetical protein